MERQHTQAYPMPSYSIQLQGHNQREFGEATVEAKPQLEHQGTLGSSPVISNTDQTQHWTAATSFYLLSVTAGSWPEQTLLCQNTTFISQNHWITTRRTWVLLCLGGFFLENVISSCYLSKGRQQMRETVKNLSLKIKKNSICKVLF